MLPLQVLDDLNSAEQIGAAPADAEPGQQQPDPLARQDLAEVGDSSAVAQAVDRQRGADIICAFNFSICLLHARSVKADRFKQSAFMMTPQILPSTRLRPSSCSWQCCAAGRT